MPIKTRQQDQDNVRKTDAGRRIATRYDRCQTIPASHNGLAIVLFWNEPMGVKTKKKDQRDGDPILKSLAAHAMSSFPSTRIVLVVAVASLLSACRVPEDPDGTTGEVTSGTLKVGALMEPLDEVETRAVARIADTLQAETDIVTGDPHNLFAQLEKGELHIVAGRIPSNTSFAPHVGLTDPVAQVTVGDETKDRVLAIRKGENQFLVTINRAIRGMSQ